MATRSESRTFGADCKPTHIAVEGSQLQQRSHIEEVMPFHCNSCATYCKLVALLYLCDENQINLPKCNPFNQLYISLFALQASEVKCASNDPSSVRPPFGTFSLTKSALAPRPRRCMNTRAARRQTPRARPRSAVEDAAVSAEKWFKSDPLTRLLCGLNDFLALLNCADIFGQ